MRLRRDKTEDAMGRPSRRSSFLGDADARFFCGTEQTGYAALEILPHRGLRFALGAPQGFTPTGVRELIHQGVGPNEKIKRVKNEYRSAGEKAVEKPLRGNPWKPGFPLRLEIPQQTRDFHFPPASTTTSLTIAITFNKMQKPASLRSED
jgi:hypothetical protein